VIALVVGAALSWVASLFLVDGAGDVAGRLESGLVGLLVGVITLRVVFSWERDRYRNALFQQLPDTVDLTVNSSLAGLPVS
jgi:Flp pilus assembly protein TadB